MVKMLLGVDISDTTIYRLTDQLGEQVTPIIDAQETRAEIEVKEDEILYVQYDGSMLLTREEGWKEVKLGRVFKSSSILPQSTNRQWIRESQYVGHLGDHSIFEDLMSQLIDEPYRKNNERIVFVGDGARWQWSWVEAEYPNAIQILDFYHAMEHLGKYISTVITKKDKASKVIKKVAGILKTKGVHTVMRYIENIPKSSKKQTEEYNNLCTYITNNKSKMDYPSYLKQSLLIGSGPIESAHRTVLQKRMKQSGQRWSNKGLSNMIKLRCASMSGYWPLVTDIIRKAA
jgi:hypothetical protein